MKKVIIAVISCQQNPYGVMMETSKRTWDSIDVEGVETIYYLGQPVQENTDKAIYFDVKEDLFMMGQKDLMAYRWMLQNKDWDYMCRINSSCYVNKKKLIDYVQTLPDNYLFSGLEVTGDTYPWIWGGGQYLISRDVIQRMVDMESKWDHSVMEDRAMSKLVNEMGIGYHKGVTASIDKRDEGWLCTCYNADESFMFTDFKDVNKNKIQFMYRIKQDYDRSQDKYVMDQLFKYLEK